MATTVSTKQDLKKLKAQHKKASATVNYTDANDIDDDDGENIDEEDAELGKTLSFIKCKPSLVKSNRDNLKDRSIPMTHQGFSSNNNLLTNASKNLSRFRKRFFGKKSSFRKKKPISENEKMNL